MGIVSKAAGALIGVPFDLPSRLTERHPELRSVRFRRGGLPVLIGGWSLGRKRVDAITLWRTIFVAKGAELSSGLLLHELRHVHQFAESRFFPLHYIWESLRRGYHDNRYERDARLFASRNAGSKPPHSKDV